MNRSIRIDAYEERWKTWWDRFVASSKNATFLFFRDYMDYHRDRFTDNSLLIWDDHGRLLALLPANREGDTLVSHGGLTYGGFLTDGRMTTPLMLDLAARVLERLLKDGVKNVIYKTIPHIYHRLPAEEDRYALFRLGAQLYRTDVTTVVIPQATANPQKRRTRGARKAHNAGVTCRQSDDFETFWAILEYNLHTVHNVRPVHTLQEMRRLQARFPDNIKLFGAFIEGEMLAGVLIYETHKVAHAQYIATSERGRAVGALDALFFWLLLEQYREKAYFDFGISTEQDGRLLNTGLIEFKEGFGGRAVVHDFFRLAL